MIVRTTLEQRGPVTEEEIRILHQAEKMPAIFDDDLYLCVTDGAEEIDINGQLYPPESLFDEGYTPDDIAELIESSTPDVIREYIDEYVLSDIVDYAKLVISMLKRGEELNEVVDSYDYIRSEMDL